MDFCQNNESIINFTTDDMTFKFELFSKKKINNQYLIEIMRTDRLYILDDYWGEKDTLQSDDYDFLPHWLYQYSNALPLGEAIVINRLWCYNC